MEVPHESTRELIQSFRQSQGRIPWSKETPFVSPHQVFQHITLFVLAQQEGSLDRLDPGFSYQSTDKARTDALAQDPSPDGFLLTRRQVCAPLPESCEQVVELLDDLHALVRVEVDADAVLRFQKLAREIHRGRWRLQPVLLHEPFPFSG